jgi:pectate lyase
MKQFFYSLFMLVFLLACTNSEEFLESIQEDAEEVPVDPPKDDDNNDDENNDEGDGSGEEDNNDDGNNDEGNEEDDAYYGEVKAFPSAEGAGAYAIGGRGGAVIPVTTLEDGNYEGTFRWALNQPYPRTIVFRVSGQINLNSGIYISGPDKGFLTIAGQTAPEGGITIAGDYLYFNNMTDIILRHFRVRQGADKPNDAITVTGVRRFIADHLSVSFGGDEAFSVTDGAQIVDDVTIQRCLFGESKTGNIIGATAANGRENNAGDFSFHHNLFAHISHRFPNTTGNGNYEVVNNVIHNWRYRLTRVVSAPKLNHVNNYYSKGPATQSRINTIMNKITISSGVVPQIYTAGNLVLPNTLTDPSADNWFTWTVFVNSGNYTQNDPAPDNMQVQTAFPPLGVPLNVQSAEEAYQSILSDIGANKRLLADGSVEENQDDLDKQYLEDVRNKTGPSVYRTRDQWVYPTLRSGTPYQDSDLDGMSDEWEIAKGLDPNNPEDRNDDENGNGFTNLEDFLNRIDL